MRLLTHLFSLSLLAGTLATAAEPQIQGMGTARDPGILNPDVIPTVYAKLGMMTSVTLVSDKPLDGAPIKGGPEINLYQQGNALLIQPAVPEGVSSITFRMAGVTYLIKVRITPQDPAIPNVVYTFPKAGMFGDNDRAIASAQSMKPSDIDLTGSIRVIERAEFDSAFRETLHSFSELRIGKVYQWNHCDINLLAAYQFADKDLILFKVSWVNNQGSAFYLNAAQYHLFIGDHAVGIQARRQLAPRSIVFPGQQETVWLAVQGYKLRLDNDWDLRLPPDAADLRPYVRQ